MKLFGKIFGMALTLLAAVGVVACTNDLSEKNLSPENIGAIKPVKTPDAIVWSGNQTFSNSLTGQSSNNTRASSGAYINPNYNKDIEDLTDEQKKHLQKMYNYCQDVDKTKLSKYDMNERSTDFYFTISTPSTFGIYLIYSKYPSSNVLHGNNGLQCHYLQNSTNNFIRLGSLESLVMYLENKTNKIYGSELEVENEYISFSFFDGSQNDDYRSTSSDKFGDFYRNIVPNRLKLFSIAEVDLTEVVKPDYFMGYDADDDGDFTDFVFWLPDVTTWTSASDESSYPGLPDYPGGGDNGEDNGDEGEGDGTPEDSSTPTGPKFTDSEVEINFALNDVHGNYDIEDLVTKLSIHVRYPHDVEVIIPVPADLYCDQDDLYILKNHYNGNYVYGGESITYDNFIGDNSENKVSLTVEYVSAEDDHLTGLGQGYISVYTEGINEEVIKYCQENFGDGINFEVYNYYNKGTMGYGNFKEISYFDLQYNYLSHSMVNFDWQERFENKIYPNLYVNAFNQIKGEPNWGDCYVWIFGDERARYNTDLYKETVTYTGPKGITTGEMKWSGSTSAEDYSVERNCFQDPYQGYHKNSSELNWIYVVKGGKTPGDASQTKMPSNPFPFPTTVPQQILVNGSPETCPTYVAK